MREKAAVEVAPEMASSAATTNAAPETSSGAIDHGAWKTPPASVAAVNGSCPMPASAVPSAWRTTNETVAFAANPLPVTTTVSPARYPVLSVATSGPAAGSAERLTAAPKQ